MKPALLLLMVASVSHGAEVLTLDEAKSELVVKTTAAGIGKGLAHNHVVKAHDVSAELAADLSKLEVTLKTASLKADDPELRRRYGETKDLDASDRQKVTESMLSDKQLDAKRYPTITFVSTKISGEGERREVSGTFTLHGVAKQLTVPVKLERREGGVVGTGRFRLRTSDFGIKPYSAALGTIRNSDEVELLVRLAFTSGANGASPH